MLNAELVRQGYAQVATYSPNMKYQELFVTLPREAQEANRELWGP
jgi:micrococcal nuclease